MPNKKQKGMILVVGLAKLLLLILLVSKNNVNAFNAKATTRIVTNHAGLVTTKRTTVPFQNNGRNSNAKSDSTTKLSLSLMRTPLIGATDNWGNWAALAGVSSVAQVVGNSTSIGRLLGPPVTAMAMTFLLASTGILNAGGTTAAKSLQLLALQLATPLILLGADLRDCISRCGSLLLSFFVASAATVVASLVGWYISGSMLLTSLGADGLIIAAALMAKNIGGGINYIAVCRSLSASPAAVAAGLCIDNIFALIYFPATSALAAGRSDLQDDTATVSKKNNKEDEKEEEEETVGSPSITVQHVSSIAFVSSLLLWFGERIGGTAGALPCCTLLTVLFASLAPRKFLSSIKPSAEVLGTFCLYLFFATAGAPGIAVADSVRSSLLPLSIFLTCLHSIHGSILYLGYKVFGKRMASFVPQRLLVASSSAIGGPATSVALAQANGWKSLMVPSLIVGNIGYAIATFCALGFHTMLK